MADSVKPTPPVFPWIRYWAAAAQTPLTEDSYLLPPGDRGWLKQTQTAELRTLAELNEIACLILLGGPGLGKTYELANEGGRCAGSANETVLLVDLKRHGPDLFREAVFGDPKFEHWKRGEHPLTLILDSLDECWEQVKDLIPALVLKLKPVLARTGHPALKLRLGCRAAEWRCEATAKLEELFGKPEKGEAARVQTWQLAPLTRDDVALAASCSGLADSGEFLDELAANDLNALAAHPLTLDLLLAEAKEGRPLGPTRIDIYRRGTLQLAHDPHEEPGVEPQNRHTTRESRRLIAARLAAHGVLSRRYLYRLPNSPKGPTEGVLEPADLLEPRESGTPAPAAQGLSPDELRETCRCGLFRGAGEDCVTWQHQAYAEFLAAEFLAARKPVRNESLTQTLLAVVSDIGTTKPRIYPPLEELALWLIELHPELFERLLPANADVLIRCHPSILTEARRAQMVDLYFEQMRRHETEAQDGKATLPLSRLTHAGLPGQLRRLLLDRAEPVDVRRSAITIAEACNCRELADDLIEVIFREGEDVRVTHGAAWCLRLWAKGGTEAPPFAPTLRERLLAEPERPDLEVLGCILPLLWPTCLSTEELLPFLTRKGQERSITSYDMLLHSELLARVRPEDLPKILRWASTLSIKRRDYHVDRQAEFVQQAARMAFSQLDEQPDVLPALVRLAISWSHYDHPSILPPKDEKPLAQDVRRRFWSALLAEPDTEKISGSFSQLAEPRGVFFVGEDLPWAVDEAVRTFGTPIGGRWQNLVSWLTRWEEQADIEKIWPLVEASTSFAELVALRTSYQLVEYDAPNWRKTQFYRNQEAERQRQELAPIEDRLSQALDFFAQGKEEALWWATEVLFLVEDERGEFNPSHGRAEPPVRHRLSEAFHTRFVAAARAYVIATPAPTPNELHLDTVPKRNVCVVRLASYFAERKFAELEALPNEWWTDWLPALLIYQSWSFGQEDAVWGRIIETGRMRQPEAFHTALRLWVKTSEAIGIEDKAWFSETLLADPVVRGILREQVLSVDARRSQAHAIGRMLLKVGDAELETALVERMAQQGADRPTCHPHAPLAAALLLFLRSDRWAVAIAEEMANQPAWASGVLNALFTPGNLPAGWISVLPAGLLARLWETLLQLVPKTPWKPGEASVVTVDHEIWKLQNILLNQLHAQTTPEAVTVLEKLIERRPDDAGWLGGMLAHVRRAARREGWQPMKTLEAARFLKESGPRPIRNLGDLCDAVMDSLERYQAYLRAPNRPTELWNERGSKRTIYTPKDENVLSNCLVTHLRRDLGAQKVWAEREVEVRRGTAAEKGDNPDLVVTAPNLMNPEQTLRLYVEVKCAWNVEAISGMGAQLFDRYLRTADCGIYVLAHYACATWNDPKDNRREKYLHSVAKAEAETQLEAERLRLQQTRPDKRLAAFFLDASL